MRSMRVLRKSRKARVAAGALMLTVPSSAVALAVGQADAQSEVQIDVSSGHVGYGHHVTVNGTVPSGTPGEAVSLEFEHAGATRWQTVGSTRIGATVASDSSRRFARSGCSGPLSRAPARRRSRRRPNVGIVGRAELPTAGFGGFEVRAPAPVDGGPRRSGRQRARDAASRASAVARCGSRDTRHGAWHWWRSARTGLARRVSDPLSPRLRAPAARAGEQLRVQFRGDRLNTGALGRARDGSRSSTRASPPGTTTRVTRRAAFTPASAWPTRRCRAAPRSRSTTADTR